MKKAHRIIFIFSALLFLFSLSACSKKMSNSSLKKDFFYIEDQYASALEHYYSDDTDIVEGYSGEFPDRSKKYIKNINSKIKKLKSNDTKESNLIAKYGTTEKKALRVLIKKHGNDDDISFKDANSKLANKISNNYFHGKHSSKMNYIKSTYYAQHNWKKITLDKKEFSVNDNDGYVLISGKGEPNKLLKIYGSKIGNHSAGVAKNGTYKVKIFYPKDSDTDIIVNYDKEEVDMPVHGNVIHSDEFSKKYIADHPQSSSTSSTSSNETDNNNTDPEDSSENDNSNGNNTTNQSKHKVTSEEKAGLRRAVDYSDTMHLSKQGIYEQLIYDGFSTETSQYVIDNMVGDWNHNALMRAKFYRSNVNESDSDIYNQLTSSADGFTPDQANYAIQHLNN
ncbi:Ltp family lipoprotein [Companilactobacillus muriivasis]|uniref:Ltp family lipoprotein n=1 Tax=Companilactobacillus muriivasis TaxID=3081444 RepID=UPI0030C6634B